MKVKFKKLDKRAVTPTYAKNGDAAMDITAISIGEDKSGNDLYIEYGTGLAIEIPKGFVGLIFPRSSVSKTDLSLANSVGVIDSGYRGEIGFRYKYPKQTLFRNGEPRALEEYTIGDRIGQLLILPYPQIEFEEVEELSSSERAEGGYGSTGN